MPSYSVLAPGQPPPDALSGAAAPGFFRDLNLDRLIEDLTTGRDEYQLAPLFYATPASLDEIAYRQDVFADLEKPDVYRCVGSFAKRMRDVRAHLARAEKLYYRQHKQAWFIETADLYCDAVQLLLADLQTAGVCSRGFQGLTDYLALTTQERVVGNDVDASGKSLVVITGANQGGKSTFVRSVGLAHLMMQCGMFVAAEFLEANVCSALFTHYKREEDAEMRSGKLDEELSRMSNIADAIRPRAVVLFNRPFASTNEREGSQIASEVIRAFRESGIRIFLVTHLFDLADSLFKRATGGALFLRAEARCERKTDFQADRGKAAFDQLWQRPL